MSGTQLMEVDNVQNPFANAPVAARPQAEGMLAVSSAREVAEVQAAMVMARRFPRDEVAIVDRILQACTRPTLADGALYEYARGGSDIRGPSIRLAECIAQYWGHLDFGWRVLEERPGVSKVQAFAWDMQTGTRSQVVFDVAHERMARGSKSTLHDPRDIYEHIANAASRRLRACILRVVPGDVVEAAVKQCEVTMRTKSEVTPERLQNLVAQFAELGVTKAAIEKRIQRRLDAMTPGMMVQLGKIFTSLRDGMSQPGDWFDQGQAQGAPGAPESGAPAPAPTSARAAVRSRLEGRSKAHAPSPAPTPAPGPAPAPAPAPAPQDEDEDEALPQLGPKASEALRDVVRFAMAANTPEDIERATRVALQLDEDVEVEIAQAHLNAAAKRISAP